MARRTGPDTPARAERGAPGRGYRKKESRSKEQPTRSIQESPSLDNWKPKTLLGSKVKNREIFHIDEILDHGQKVLEPEIVDSLMTLEQDLLMVGQSKGKFGGGARRVFRQTQKKTMEGNKPKFATVVVVGDKNGHVGLGFGKAKETVPAREKAIRKAKLNLFKIRRGCGSWQCNCGKPHSIPFTVNGKCGSIEVKFIPAPKGKGLCCQKEIAKVLELAGIKDVWVKTRGQTRNLLNFAYACEDALRQLMLVKLKPEDIVKLGVVEGSIEQASAPSDEEVASEEIAKDSAKHDDAKAKAE